MGIETRPLHSLLGVETAGVDLRHVDEPASRDIQRSLEDHSVLRLRGQALTDAEPIAFSRRFGPLEAPESSQVLA